MEKKFTLMKTLTAFLDLLFPRRKNSRAVNNNQASTTGGCGTAVHDHFKYVNDAKQVDASFLFFEQAVDDQQSIDHGQPSIEKDQKLKSKEELKKIFGKNTELRFNQSPQQKLDFIKSLQNSPIILSEKRNTKNVLMLGDGLNDAGALMQSNVGIAVSDKEITPAQMALAVGRSWEQNLSPGLKFVNTIVGMHNNGWVLPMTKLQQRIDDNENAIQVLTARLDNMENKSSVAEVNKKPRL